MVLALDGATMHTEKGASLRVMHLQADLEPPSEIARRTMIPTHDQVQVHPCTAEAHVPPGSGGLVNGPGQAPPLAGGAVEKEIRLETDTNVLTKVADGLNLLPSPLARRVPAVEAHPLQALSPLYIWLYPHSRPCPDPSKTTRIVETSTLCSTIFVVFDGH